MARRSCNELLLALLVVAAMASPLALAYDPSPLQDFCVANTPSNGTYTRTSHLCHLLTVC